MPKLPIARLIKFTMVCGLFCVLILQVKKQVVPKKNTTMFQGYTFGPIAFKLCPAMTKGAPAHCNMSLVSNFINPIVLPNY